MGRVLTGRYSPQLALPRFPRFATSPPPGPVQGRRTGILRTLCLAIRVTIALADAPAQGPPAADAEMPHFDMAKMPPK